MQKPFSRHLKTETSFSLFTAGGILLISIIVILVTWFSLRSILINQQITAQLNSINNIVDQLDQYVEVRANELMGQRQLPLITQAVLQPEILLPSVKDLFRDLSIQNIKTQQLLLDFAGDVIYARFSPREDSFSDSPWFMELSDNPGSRSMRLVSGASPYVEIALPVVYNDNTEGFFLAHLRWQRMKNILSLDSRLTEFPLSIGKPEDSSSIIIGKNNDSQWHKARQEFLNYPIYYKVNLDKINSYTYQHLTTILLVLSVIAVLVTYIAIAWGKRYFVTPIKELDTHIVDLAEGSIKEINIPDHASVEMLALTRQFNSMARSVRKREKQLTETNQQLIANQAQLLHSEKMASIGTMAAGVAHEINNPIAFVMSNNNFLEEMVSNTSHLITLIKSGEVQAAIDFINSEGLNEVLEDCRDVISENKTGLQRVKDIVTSLKQFTHSDGDKTEVVDLKRCLEFTIKLIWNELKYRAKVSTDLNSNIYVRANEGQLSQVFTNLLINASHAIEEGGEIGIKLSTEGENAVISIRDNGKGMSEQTLQKIFEPFYTDKPVGVGSGLGLSISYGIIEKYEGDIQVNSTLGEGSVFTVCLPLSSTK